MVTPFEQYMRITKMLIVAASMAAGLVGFSWMVPTAEAGMMMN